MAVTPEVAPPDKSATPAVASTPNTEPSAPKAPQLVRNYWPVFKQRTVFFVVSMQVIGTLIVGLALIIGGIGRPDSIFFWIALLAIGATTVGLNIIVFYQVADPIKQLTHALTHAAGEKTVTTPPNPNIPRFERSGLKPLLQTIYELGGDKKSTTSDQPISAAVDLNTALNASSSGFVVLGHTRDILYANSSAPIHDTPEGKRALELVFDDVSLEDWLDECDQKAVHAERIWLRVANKLPGEEGRKLYDISASYEKGNAAEVVINFLERTDEYLPDDENLDFIAFAAHELRGPITVIRGYLDVLGDELGDQLTGDQTELLKRLVVSANRLSSYVNNILNASRYDRRHLKVHLREDSLAEIYDTIADDMSLRASSQNRLLAVTIPADLPTVAADRGSLSEVFSNLIDNAIKYSNEGGSVAVTAHENGDMVEVSVEDHGIGIPSNVIGNLFNKFYRSHRSRETVAGTGIGLYITKAIIESHGGTISVRSQEGQGATFTFSVPVYATVADKLKVDDTNAGLIKQGEGWINNHSMFRG